MNHRRIRIGLLRGVLLLSLLLILCACVAEGTESSSAPAGNSSVGSSATASVPEEQVSHGSEAAESSAEESAESSSPPEVSGDASSEDQQPEPPVYQEPEEQDASLEQITSFEVGNGDTFEYGICCSRTAYPAEILTPTIHGADKDGNVYVFWELCVIRLSDGARLKHGSAYTEAGMVFAGDSLYLLFTDNSVQKYDLSDGFENAVLIHTYKLTDDAGKTGRLYAAGDTEPYWVSSAGEVFSLDGQRRDDVLPAGQGDLFHRSSQGYSTTQSRASFGSEALLETVYTAYDLYGNVTARFLMSERQNGRATGYKMPYKYGKIKYYYGWTITVGKTVFEKAVNAVLVGGAAGDLFLVVYYPEHGEVYRVDPGYSQAELSASKDSAPSRKLGVFLKISREQTKQNVLEMIETVWNLRTEHLDADYDTVLPTYLLGQSGEQLGIPYCRGGFYGGSCYGKDSFAYRVQQELDYGFYYTTGNVNPDVGHQPFTIGLDCSGFVCAAWEFIDSGSGWDVPDFHWTSPDGLTKYGHEVASVYDLKEMDILIKPGDNAHVMFFACIGPNNTVGVYEVTSLLLPEKTVFRYVDINRLHGYTFVHPYRSYGADGESHWFCCDSCDMKLGEKESHFFANGVCTQCGYEQ